jgi:hypothetical protein
VSRKKIISFFLNKKMGGTCGTYGERGTYMVLSEGKRTLRRRRRKCEDNIKMLLQEIGLVRGLDLSNSEKGRWLADVDTVMNLRLP